MKELSTRTPELPFFTVSPDQLPRGLSMDTIGINRTPTDFILPDTPEHHSWEHLKRHSVATSRVAQWVISSFFDSMMHMRSKARVEAETISRRFGGNIPVFHFHNSTPEGRLLINYHAPVKGSVELRIPSQQQLRPSGTLVEPHFERLDVTLGTLGAMRFQVQKEVTELGFDQWSFRFLQNPQPLSQDSSESFHGQEAIDRFLHLTVADSPLVQIKTPHVVFLAQSPQ